MTTKSADGVFSGGGVKAIAYAGALAAAGPGRLACPTGLIAFDGGPRSGRI
jgi:hypothetical protein